MRIPQKSLISALKKKQESKVEQSWMKPSSTETSDSFGSAALNSLCYQKVPQKCGTRHQKKDLMQPLSLLALYRLHHIAAQRRQRSSLDLFHVFPGMEERERKRERGRAAGSQSDTETPRGETSSRKWADHRNTNSADERETGHRTYACFILATCFVAWARSEGAGERERHSDYRGTRQTGGGVKHSKSFNATSSSKNILGSLYLQHVCPAAKKDWRMFRNAKVVVGIFCSTTRNRPLFSQASLCFLDSPCRYKPVHVELQRGPAPGLAQVSALFTFF